MKNKLIGYYNYTVVLTYIGMLIGFLGIVRTMEGDLSTGIKCLMIAGVCDMFDGAIASTKQRTMDERYFGIQIDSLSDLICFGVLPAIIMYSTNKRNDIAYAIAALYVLCALIRLAYYNVDEQNRQKTSNEGRKYFTGLPVTTVAMVFPFVYELGRMDAAARRGLAYQITLVIMGVMFLSPVKIKKPQITGKIALGICGLLEFVFLIAGFGDV